jgi:hypothetical protein
MNIKEFVNPLLFQSTVITSFLVGYFYNINFLMDLSFILFWGVYIISFIGFFVVPIEYFKMREPRILAMLIPASSIFMFGLFESYITAGFAFSVITAFMLKYSLYIRKEPEEREEEI